MLDQLMSVGDLIERNDLCDVRPLPPRLKCPVDVPSGFDLCLGRYIVAAYEEQSGVHKHKLPDWSLRHRRVHSVSRNRTSLRQQFCIGLDVRSKCDFHDVIDSVRSQSANSFSQALSGQHNFVCSCSRCDFLVAFGTASGDYSCSGLMRKLNSTSSYRTCTALHKNGLALDRTRDINRPMSRYSGYAKTCSLLQKHAFWKFDHLLERNHGVLCGSSEGAIGLSAIAPYAPTDPFPRNAITDCIDRAGTVAVRNDTRVRHPYAKRIFALLDIAGIYT